MADMQGKPVWYELSTAPGKLNEAAAFYGDVLKWDVSDSGMEGMAYHVANMGDDMIAGLMEIPAEAGDMPPAWLIYYAVESCDETAEAIRNAGGEVHQPPADIPGTGRFAIVGDPQGAVFGILAAGSEGGESTAFAMGAPGHGAWNELMSSDPEAALRFYSALFGWTRDEVMDTGDMGPYQIIAHEGQPMGAVMGLGNAPVPVWLPYFGVESCDAAAERIRAGGGAVEAGPMPIPNDMFVVIARDPQGAWFAVLGAA